MSPVRPAALLAALALALSPSGLRRSGDSSGCAASISARIRAVGRPTARPSSPSPTTGPEGARRGRSWWTPCSPAPPRAA